MKGFDPTTREQAMVCEHLPCTKEELIKWIVAKGWSERYVRSLIWNMKRVGQIYTGDGHLIKKV